MPEIEQAAKSITSRGTATSDDLTVKIVPHSAAPGQVGFDQPHWSIEATRTGKREIVNAEPTRGDGMAILERRGLCSLPGPRRAARAIWATRG